MKNITNVNFKFLLFLVILIPFNLNSKTVVDLIKTNPDLSLFYTHLKETGLEEVLEKKLPWKWTVFAPTNKAFKSIPQTAKDKILSDKSFSKSLMMDHLLTGQKISSDFGEDATTVVTVSNKPLQLFKKDSLFVKDMVVVKENINANNGVIHHINCLMFVQPSEDDFRLTESQQKKFPITSCCMRTDTEVTEWIKSAKEKF